MKPDSENDIASGRRRRIDRRAMARISPLPPPEEVFSDWLVSVPKEDSLEAAARYQIELIDRSAAASHPDVQHLRMLFVAFCGDSAWKGPISNL
ncbi:MAG: hypothetical protein WBA44_11435 [Mesorhizobium sp.]